MTAHAEIYNLQFEKTKPPLVNLLSTDLLPNLDPSHMNYLMALFLVLLSAMTIRQGTVLIQSKGITQLGNKLNYLNKQDAEIKFVMLPKGAKTDTINRVQEENEQYAATREDIQNAMMNVRQVSEVQMTQASTNVNILQQDASENSAWLQTISTIFQVIDEISQRQ